MEIKHYTNHNKVDMEECLVLFDKVKKVEYDTGAPEQTCHNCTGKNITTLGTSELWLHANYCIDCGHMGVWCEADRMSGNFVELVYIFKNKVPKVKTFGVYRPLKSVNKNNPHE